MTDIHDMPINYTQCISMSKHNIVKHILNPLSYMLDTCQSNTNMKERFDQGREIKPVLSTRTMLCFDKISVIDNK